VDHPKVEAQPSVKAATSIKAEDPVPPKFGFWDGFWVSVRHFLPVEIPAGARWKPRSNSVFEVFATLLKLAGWILVPVGLAGLTGILKR